MPGIALRQIEFVRKKAMDELELYVPKLDDLWFRRKMMSDPETMSYNANWDMEWDGYHKDTGCIDFPESEWATWYEHWISNEQECFYAYIRRCVDGAWIGEVNFHYTPEKRWWDMGIVICSQYRRKGYSVPALRLMLDHAFCKCGISILHNDFEVTRPAALRTHLSAGFKKMGVENELQHVMLTKEEYLCNK